MKNSASPTRPPQPGSLVDDSGHLLQTPAWGDLKSHFGWSPHRVQVGSAAAQILFRRLPLGWTIGYIPKGPVVDWHNSAQCHALFSLIHTEARRRRAIFLKIEPPLSTPEACPDSVFLTQTGALPQLLSQAGFVPGETIQPQTTIVLDISGDEETILAAMKQKTRYNIRLAERKGVTVRCGQEADLACFYRLARLTASRDGFGIHALSYYQLAYRLFAPDRGALLLAEFEGELLAALMVFRHAQEAYYLYGASSNTRRNLMAAYLVQWAAIGWAKSQGCTRYDLWGIPNADPTTLEAEFSHRSEGLWGVYRFKRGFGGQIVKSVGAYDYIYNPLLYHLYKLGRRLPGGW
jgi:lipid II:glycine glycyltransferase (peptidoglycan interpeptide bridge formation enzyme)